jgi:RHS repeat-associated protein
VAPQQTGANRTYTLYTGPQVLSEFSDASTATYTTGTTPGQAPSDTVALLLYQHSDHMSKRVATDNFGNVADQKAHYPFGDSWYETGGAMNSVPHKFTKYMVEPELASSAVHQALYREHSARLGRFHTPDVKPGNQLNPQHMNRYSYAGNDPINMWDPDGLDIMLCVDDSDIFVATIGSGGGGGGDGPGQVLPVDPINPPDPVNPPNGPSTCDPVTGMGCTPNPQPCDPADPSCGSGLGLGGYTCFCFLATAWSRCILGCEYICECGPPSPTGLTTILTLPQFAPWSWRCQEVTSWYCNGTAGPGNCRPLEPICYNGD